MEDGFSRLDKWQKLLLVVVLDALLLHAEFDMPNHPRNDISRVLQPGRETPGVSLPRQKQDVVDGIVLGELQAVLVVVGVDIVRVDAIKALLARQVEPSQHDAPHGGRARAHPCFAVPVVHLAAQVGLGELRGIGAPFLVRAGREVGDDLVATLVQRRDGGGGRVEEVQDVDSVVGQGWVVEAERVPEDVVPSGAYRGLPEGVEAHRAGRDGRWV